MRDRERQFRRRDDGLRCDATGPEHRDLARLDRHGIAIIGLRDVADAEQGRRAARQGGTVSGRKAGGTRDGAVMCFGNNAGGVPTGLPETIDKFGKLTIY